MRISKLAWITATAIAITGCASTHGLHTRGQPLAAGQLRASRSLAHASLSPAAWPARDWWTQLGDPQLDRLIREALKNNADLAAADAKAREAQAQAMAVDAGRKPTLNAGGSIAGAHLPTTVLPAPYGGRFQWAKYVYGSFSWSPDLWGGERAAWEAAVGRERATEVAAREARLQLSANVARAYAQLDYAFRASDIAKAEHKRVKTMYDLTRQRVQAGIDSQLQLIRAKGELAAVQEQVDATAHQVEADRVALAVLLGKGPDAGLKIQRPHGLKASAFQIPSQVPAVLVGRRPDLVAARWRVEAAQHQVKNARTKFLPGVSISALAGLLATGGTDLFQWPARFYNVAPSISIPVFEGGRLRANLKSRDAQYDLAVAQYNKTLVGAINQIADDVSGARAVEREIASQRQAADSAQHAWNLAQQLYKAGVGSYLQALSARQQLLQARQRLAALKTQKIDLSIQLIQALGGGFQPAAPAPASASSSTQASHPVPSHD